MVNDMTALSQKDPEPRSPTSASRRAPYGSTRRSFACTGGVSPTHYRERSAYDDRPRRGHFFGAGLGCLWLANFLVAGLILVTLHPWSPVNADAVSRGSAGILPAAVAADVAVDVDVPAWSTETDPFRRCARKALAGEYGALKPWQRTAYERGLRAGLTAARGAKRTTYCPRCSGRTCADGSPVRRGVVSASRNVPMHSLVWLATDGLLLVTDRGGWVKVGGRFTRAGESANFDVWKPRCVGDCWHGPGTKRRVPYVILRAGAPGGES
jgi:hypothetical protein